MHGAYVCEAETLLSQIKEHLNMNLSYCMSRIQARRSTCGS